jgi:hypothetical protein
MQVLSQGVLNWSLLQYAGPHQLTKHHVRPFIRPMISNRTKLDTEAPGRPRWKPWVLE